MKWFVYPVDEDKKITVVQIDGAVLISEIKFDEESEEIIVPAVAKTEYKYFTVFDLPDPEDEDVSMHFPFVSKDLKDWVIPISIIMDGEHYNPMVIAAAWFEEINDDIS